MQEPPNGGYGWVIVFALFMCETVIIGIISSFGILLIYFVDYYEMSKKEAAWIGSSLIGCYFLIGPLSCTLSNRFGFRPVAVVGSLVSSAGFLLSTVASNRGLLIFTYGILGGTGFSFTSFASNLSVNYYFSSKRAFAVGIARCGSSVGKFLFPFLLNFLLGFYDWKGTLVILSGLCLNCMVFAALMKPLPMSGSRCNIHCRDPVIPESKGRNWGRSYFFGEEGIDKNAMCNVTSPSERCSNLLKRKMGISRISSSAEFSFHRCHETNDSDDEVQGIALPTASADQQLSIIPLLTQEPCRVPLQIEDENQCINIPSGVQHFHTQRRFTLPSVMPASVSSKRLSQRINSAHHSNVEADKLLSAQNGMVEQNLLRCKVIFHNDSNINIHSDRNIIHHKDYDGHLNNCSDHDDSNINIHDDNNINIHDASNINIHDDSNINIRGNKNISMHREHYDSYINNYSYHVDNIGVYSNHNSSYISIQSERNGSNIGIQNDSNVGIHSDSSNSYISIQSENSDSNNDIHNDSDIGFDSDHSNSYISIQCERNDSTMKSDDDESNIVIHSDHNCGNIEDSSDMLRIYNGQSFNDNRICNDYSDSITVIYSENNIQEIKIKSDNGIQSKLTISLTSLFQNRSQSFPKCLGIIKGLVEILKETMDISLLNETKFKILSLANIIGMMGYFVPFAFLPHMSVGKGIDRERAAFLVSAIGVANLFGRLMFGYMADKPKVSAFNLYTVSVFISGSSCLAMPLCLSYPSILCASIVYGFFSAPFIILNSIVLVDIYGLENLSSTVGLTGFFRGVGSIIGPPIAGAIFDATGSYDIPFYITGLFLIVSSSLAAYVSCVIRRQENQNASE